MLNIVMYHYVRELWRSRFPRIKGLTIDAFRGQLEYIERHYNVVSMEEVIWAAQGGGRLPARAALLTFDDGFIDHYTNVLPLLHERSWQGSFFPPSRPIVEGCVLDVHKIHFTLAAVDESRQLADDLMRQVDRCRDECELLSGEQYWELCGRPSRFDPTEVVFIKRMLQHELPAPIRQRITDYLFRKYVTTDESAFATELYMSLDQLRMMHRCGMYIGNHGDSHCWLDKVSREQKVREIEASLMFLQQIDPEMGPWAMCYPYGAHDSELRELVRSYGAAVGFSTRVAVADFSNDDPLALPRLDTNDLPTCTEDIPELMPVS
jgi:peptidoglycan/xylan/chitin deacetylase (PgdA/CDA1 family)